MVDTKDPWANLDSSNSAATDGWADFGSFTTQFDTQKPSSTADFPDTSNPTAAVAVLSTTDIQSAGDQKMESPENNKAETVEKPAADTVQASEATEKTSTDNQQSTEAISTPSAVPADTTTTVADPVSEPAP